jgi:hypothetical protein
MPDDLRKLLADRTGWTDDGHLVTYRSGGWSATVRVPAIPSRPSHRWTISVIDPAGRARFTTWATTAAEAIRVAERHVYLRGRGS